MIAASHGHLHVVQYLTRICGLDVEATDSLGRTALTIAAAEGHIEVVRHLAKECEADVTHQPLCGLPALHAASAAGHLEVARFLIEETYVQPEMPSREGSTPFEYAETSG